ncbi:hypothetical protein [Frigidibacter mobilis]|uniref:DUF1127 domain-containing protein n=1 Tax=Frigidibacter mobilis TaxID=1335048 RepID=A0A159Z279_9RHOB|nr:hypothetical protein [Frigidibacter mobilis]AMY69117.1 hypothetical protein AKL17_1867 [Frigidibacter mobilis]
MTTLTMTHNPLATLRSALATFFAAFAAARSVSAAMEARRTPDPEALRTLGIDPSGFPSNI